MANQTYTLKDKPASAQQGRNTGPTNTKPKSIKIKTVKPGYRPEDKVTKTGEK